MNNESENKPKDRMIKSGQTRTRASTHEILGVRRQSEAATPLSSSPLPGPAKPDTHPEHRHD